MTYVCTHFSLRAAQFSGVAAVALLIAAPPQAVNAQSATQLPGIVVEAATLSKPARRPTGDGQGAGGGHSATPAPAPSPGPVEAVDSGQASDAAAQTEGGARGYAREAIGSSVSVVTRQELENAQIRHAADALRSLPGVSVNRGGSVASQTQVRIRGAEGNHTLVLIDGIVANQPGTGEFDFSNLSTEEIERIEVVKGAQSSLYGSGAIGGVVNIVTRRGQGPAKVTVTSETGSFKTAAGGISVSGGNDRAHGLISYNARHTNGYNISSEGNETEAATQRSFLLKGGILPTQNFSIDVIARNVDKRGDRDGDLFAFSGLSRQTDTPSFFKSNVWLAGIEAKLLSFDGRLEQRARYNYAETILEDTDAGAFGTFVSRNDNARRTGAYVASLSLDTPAMARVLRHSVTGLVEHESETFVQVTGDNLTRERTRLATAGEYRAELFERLTVTANVRHDDNETFADFTTWRTAASLNIRELGLRPHASYGTGVKLPTMVEQFGQFAGFIPNANLKAEESIGWDAGIELSLARGAFVIDATYFKANLENEIVTRFLPFFQSTAENLTGTSTREGVELTARWRPTPVLTLGAAYTWLDARDDKGLPEIRRASDSGRVDATYAFAQGRGTITVAAAYNGRMDDLAFGLPTFETVRVKLDDYWLATVAARYEIRPGVEVLGRIENAFDAQYQEVYGFETAGIAAYAGLKLTFGGEAGLKP